MTFRQFLDTLANSAYVRLIIRRPDGYGSVNYLIDQMNPAEIFKDPMYGLYHNLQIKPVYIGTLREYTTFNVEIDLPILEEEKAVNDQ